MKPTLSKLACEVIMSMKKRRVCFTEEEDRRILEFVSKFGIENAPRFLSIMLDRSVRSIKERYENALNPRFNQNFTEEDDILLLQLVADYKHDWTKISNTMQDKSPSHVKSRYAKLQGLLKKGMIDSEGRRNSNFVERSFGLKNRRIVKPKVPKEQLLFQDFAETTSALFDCTLPEIEVPDNFSEITPELAFDCLLPDSQFNGLD